MAKANGERSGTRDAVTSSVTAFVSAAQKGEQIPPSPGYKRQLEPQTLASPRHRGEWLKHFGVGSISCAGWRVNGAPGKAAQILTEKRIISVEISGARPIKGQVKEIFQRRTAEVTFSATNLHGNPTPSPIYFDSSKYLQLKAV